MEKIEEVNKESAIVDFKECADFSSLKDQREIVKDIVSMANSGGGYILFGIKDDGTLSNIDVSPILNLDPAKLTDQIKKRYRTALF